MTPSVKKLIAEYFPGERPEDLLRVLTRFGDGLGHSGSALDYAYIVRRAGGNKRVLLRLVEEALADHAVFTECKYAWKAWMRSPAELGWWEPVLRECADEVLQYDFRFHYSHSVLCLFPPNSEGGTGAKLYVHALPDQRIRVADQDPHEDGSALGEDFEPTQAARAISRAISNVFDKKRRHAVSAAPNLG